MRAAAGRVPAQRSATLRISPLATRSASAIATMTAMRRKSFSTNERSSAAALSSEAEGAPIARAVPVRYPYRSRDGAGRVASRSMICGRGTDARRPASTERRGRERMRCFFATGG